MKSADSDFPQEPLLPSEYTGESESVRYGVASERPLCYTDRSEADRRIAAQEMPAAERSLKSASHPHIAIPEPRHGLFESARHQTIRCDVSV